MKTIKVAALGAAVLITLIILSFSSSGPVQQTETGKPVAGNGFAVLELFTSEGCSSCPPADELMAEIQKSTAGQPVYILAYHVDYWDRQGWKDVFSNQDFTARQYAYSRSLPAQVYTPQLVINGRKEFIASIEPKVREGLAQALSGKPEIDFDISAVQQGDQVKVGYQIRGDAGKSRLELVWVQKQAVTHVKRGENEGRTLSHVQIVKKLYSFPLDASQGGNVQIKLPQDYKSGEFELIGMLKDTKTAVIKAAARTEIKPV